MSETAAPNAGCSLDLDLTDREKLIVDYFLKRQKTFKEDLEVTNDMCKKLKEECQKQTELADSFKSKADSLKSKANLLKSMADGLSESLHICESENRKLKSEEKCVYTRKKRPVSTFDDSFLDEVESEPEEGSNDDERMIKLD